MAEELDVTKLPTAAERAAAARTAADDQRAMWAFGAGPQCLVNADQLEEAAKAIEAEQKALDLIAASTPAEIAAQIAKADADYAAEQAKLAKERENMPPRKKP